MINSLSAISRLKSFTASKPFGYLFVMCCKDKLAIFESSLNEHHAFYYEFCICISLAYGTSIPFLPAFDHATITQTFLRQIGNSAFGFSQPFSSVHFAQTKCSLLYKMTKRKVYILFIAFFWKIRYTFLWCLPAGTLIGAHLIQQKRGTNYEFF